MSNMFYGENAEDFIFDENATFEEGCTKSKTESEIDPEVDKEVEECGVMECFDDPEVSCYRIALENEQNYNTIMNAIAVSEMVTLESGQEVVYEAGKVKKFFERIKEIVLSFWKKIQGVFKAAITKIGTYVTTNKKFVEKYKGKKMEFPTKAKDFKGYTFDGIKNNYFSAISSYVINTSNINNVQSYSADAAKVMHDAIDINPKKDIVRGIACTGEKKPIKQEDFVKELKKTIFGSEKKKEIKLPSFETLIKSLSEAKEQKDILNKSYKEAKGAVKTHLSKIKDAEKKLAKDSEGEYGMKIAKGYTDLLTTATNVMTQTIRMQMSACFSKCAQDRAMANFYVQNQPSEGKPKANEESAVGGFLDDVELV